MVSAMSKLLLPWHPWGKMPFGPIALYFSYVKNFEQWLRIFCKQLQKHGFIITHPWWKINKRNGKKLK